MKSTYITFLVLALTGMFLVKCVPDDDDIPDTGDRRDQLVGTWLVDEDEITIKKDLKDMYQVYIQKDPEDTTQILIGHFYQLGYEYDCIATLNDDEIEIPLQTLNLRYIEGTGTVSSNNRTINLTYSVDHGEGVSQVTSLYTKQ